MDKAKIAKLCNEIEDVACDIARITMNDIISAESIMIFEKAKEIASEITAPPKSNADRIRQMTDEELAERFGFEECKDSRYGYECPGWHAADCGHATCKKYFLEWLRKEVDEDAAD